MYTVRKGHHWTKENLRISNPKGKPERKRPEAPYRLKNKGKGGVGKTGGSKKKKKTKGTYVTVSYRSFWEEGRERDLLCQTALEMEKGNN